MSPCLRVCHFDFVVDNNYWIGRSCLICDAISLIAGHLQPWPVQEWGWIEFAGYLIFQYGHQNILSNDWSCFRALNTLLLNWKVWSYIILLKFVLIDMFAYKASYECSSNSSSFILLFRSRFIIDNMCWNIDWLYRHIAQDAVSVFR